MNWGKCPQLLTLVSFVQLKIHRCLIATITGTCTHEALFCDKKNADCWTDEGVIDNAMK